MAGVEQPQLHQLVRRHVFHRQHADLFERRPAGGKVVLERPGGERLRDHRPLVFDAELLGQSRDDLGGGDRGDSVDHRVGEFRVLRHPAGQAGVGSIREGAECLPRDVSVALDVVAGHDRRRFDAALAAP
jgi:hypothetical protein